jgi:hypothetical protein
LNQAQRWRSHIDARPRLSRGNLTQISRNACPSAKIHGHFLSTDILCRPRHAVFAELYRVPRPPSYFSGARFLLKFLPMAQPQVIDLKMQKKVRPDGFEPPTTWFEACHTVEMRVFAIVST